MIRTKRTLTDDPVDKAPKTEEYVEQAKVGFLKIIQCGCNLTMFYCYPPFLALTLSLHRSGSL